MISIGKLRRLRRETRLRKIAVILQSYELAFRSAREADLDYLAEVGTIILEDDELPERVKERFRACPPGFAEIDLLRLCNGARHDILMYLGAEPADWDFLVPESGSLDARLRVVLPISLYLDDIRSPFNVGSIFRSSEAFGVAKILVSEATPLPTHPRARRASMGCSDVVPWDLASRKSLEAQQSVFALETGGTPIEEFRFPNSGTLIVGSEELGVSPELLDLADASAGRVSIPLFGAKASLNVGQAVSIVLYHWSRRLRNPNA
ncbi:MAG TPA: TrmH family RNA methyltransferase [Spirochaetia bacterium]|nr:TrmH family RNA methyltransferase [Spirochaetia bacterium]